MLTPAQLQAARQKLGITVQDPAVQSRTSILDTAWAKPEQFKATGALGGFQDFAKGASKGATSTLLGIGHLGQGIQAGVGKGADSISSAITGHKVDTSYLDNQGVFNPQTEQGAKAQEMVTPQGTTETFGKGTEQAAEFLAPAGKATDAEKLVAEGSKILPGIWGAAARIAGKSTVQGLAAGGVKAIQTGGDLAEAGKTALGAAAARGAFAVIGEGANALKIPERLYQTVFKNTKNDMLKELRSETFKAWQQQNPEEFQKMIDAGVIKTGEDGAPIVNDTLAERALNHGLKGSVQNMANTVVKGAAKSELAAREIAANHPEPIDLSHENYLKVLDDVGKEYEGVGFGEVSDEANKLASKLELSEGKVDATTALQLRRFFDRLRLASSFDKPASKLSLTQQNFKTLADSIRTKVNGIPGMGPVMKDYSLYIDTLDALAQHAKRTGNNQILSLIDSIFLGAGLGAGSAPALFMGGIRRAVNTPAAATYAGQALKGGVMGPIAGAAENAAASAATQPASP